MNLRTRWRAWAQKPARLPGKRRKITVRGWSIDVLYPSSWSSLPLLITNPACLAPGIVAVLVLPGKRGLGLAREAEWAKYEAEVL